MFACHVGAAITSGVPATHGATVNIRGFQRLGGKEVAMGNLYCQNYATCNGMMLDRGDDHTNEQHARAKGWHIYHGTTMGGDLHEGLLCPKCADNNRRRLSPAPPLLPGQQELISIEVIVDPGAESYV